MTDENKVAEQTAQTETPATEPEVDYKAKYEAAIAEVERYKNGITKTNAEISKLKKDIAENLTKEQQAALEAKNAQEEMARKIKEYERERTVSHYKDKFIENGHDLETAAIMANALPDGVDDSYFAADKKHNEAIIAKAKADAINAQPKLTAGSTPSPEDELLKAMMKAAGV